MLYDTTIPLNKNMIQICILKNLFLISFQPKSVLPHLLSTNTGVHVSPLNNALFQWLMLKGLILLACVINKVSFLDIRTFTHCLILS